MHFKISSYQVSFAMLYAFSKFPWLLENYIGIKFLRKASKSNWQIPEAEKA